MSAIVSLCVFIVGLSSVAYAQTDCLNRLCPIIQDQDVTDAAPAIEAYDPIGRLLSDVMGDINRATCPIFPRSLRSKVSVNIHCAQPTDIRVFAALGDSLSAGVGASCDSETIDCIINEYRGAAFSTGVFDSTNGGYRTRTLTLPNLFRQFSGFVIGGGRGVNGFRDCEFNSPACFRGFNFADPAAIIADLPDQARGLVEALGDLRNERVPKMITIFIGGTDTCCQCSATTVDVVALGLCSREGALPDAWARDMRETLQILKDNLPNTLVNLIGMFDVTDFQEAEGFFCERTLPFFCPCAFLPELAASRNVPIPPGVTREFINENLLRPTVERYNLESQAIANQLSDGSFEVIYHPLGRDFTIPRNPDGSFDRNSLAIDCFHYSHRTHGDLAVTLWNSIMRVDKPTDFETEPQCPSTRYIPTRLNAGGTKCPFTKKPHQ